MQKLTQRRGSVRCLLGLLICGFIACAVDQRDLAVESGGLDPEGGAMALPSVALPPVARANLPVGSSCTDANECTSSFCTDGVCCDRFCQDVCAACNLPGQLGICSAASDDPLCTPSDCLGDSDCRSHRATLGLVTCEAVGRCLPIPSLQACASVDAAAGTPCSAGTGQCDGAGACQVDGKKSLGATCSMAAECAEGNCAAAGDGSRVCCDAACDGVCERCAADGRCTEAPVEDVRCPAVSCPASDICRSYGPPPSGCRDVSSCATAADCTFQELRPSSECDCALDGGCRLVQGAACAADSECASGACVDGICCNRACDACERCAPDSGQCVDSGECQCRSGEVSTCGAVHGSLGECAGRTLACTASGTWPPLASCAPAGPELCDAERRDEDCDGVANERPPCEAYAQIDVGRFHVCGRSTTGSVLCWGFNDEQQIGDGSTATRNEPFVVPGLADVRSVSAGASRTCVLGANGGVRCWGSNRNGALGDGTMVDRAAPVPVAVTGVTALEAGAGDTTCVLLSSGGVSCWGALVGSATPAPVPGFEGVTALAGGADHLCGLVASTGEVRCFGGNTVGQLGDGTTTGNVVRAVAVPGLTGVRALGAGTLHTCAVLSSGQVQCWGYNASGQLGDGTTVDRLRPTTVGGISNAVAVAGGDGHSCAILSDGSLRCWGNDDIGQLGRGERGNSLTPVAVVDLGGTAVSVGAGQNHTCALLADGSARCWGLVLGDGTGFNSPVPVRVLSP